MESVLSPILRKLSRRTALTQSDRAAFLALPFTVKRLNGGSHIMREGDEPVDCCGLLSGYAYRHKIVGNGSRQIVSIHIAGDLLDLQNSLLGVADHNVQMLTAGEVALTPARAVRELAFAHPAIGRAMWIETLVDGSIFREWIANVGRRDARSRIAHLLCEFAVRLRSAGLSEGSSYELPMTQEQIADATGLTPIHVNRTLQGLRVSGLITSNRRTVTIEDWAGLAKVGDFSAAYLHPESAGGLAL
ncbi:Crp/Fnr family transcriptional regulator [Sphingomonas profundi]|uniref:Crp/Fnr family transcriptional regulator n=1 Tax=Alterirhizorhabdus profundi TaxID=2681549 RepID=UPI0012E7419F|nr:Crp/Fnr family transcriptional regulator [Sphingomonas profundi]